MPQNQISEKSFGHWDLEFQIRRQLERIRLNDGPGEKKLAQE
jgi:hypothetical protein